MARLLMRESVEDDVNAISKIAAVERILEVVCRTTGLGFSAVARVTDKQWVACAVRDEISFGLKPGGELVLQTTICDEIRQSGKLVAIDHVAQDKIFCDHHTPRQYGFQSYISVPINLPDGRFFGTLCAIDPRPAKVNTPGTIEMFRLFAEMIAMYLDAQDRMAASEAALLGEREAAQLREQFIAVLGHDLRNPLSAINSAVYLLKSMPQSDDSRDVIEIVDRSVARMAELIGNVVDFARGRLGGGLTLNRTPDPNLAAVLGQVVAELQTAWPKRAIHGDIAIASPVSCDSGRIGQLLSNLIGNAITHGGTASPVWVKARTTDGKFELSVTNRGETIPRHVIDRMFQPFVRGSADRKQQGLGLGLYIASEIARAHRGNLTVKSVNGETTFTFVMPE